MIQWERIKQIIIDEGLVQGEFITSSGLKTDHYYDLRKVMSNPKHLWDIGLLMCNIGISDKYQSVGCMAIGSIPLAVAISFIRNIPFFYVRSEQKKHGMQKQIEGTVKEPYMIIDDVYTTGKSINMVREALGNPKAEFIVLINRSNNDINAFYTEEDLKK